MSITNLLYNIGNAKYDTIDLSNMGLFDVQVEIMISTLNKYEHIKYLNFYRNNLGNESLKHIEGLNYIEDINLCYNNINNQGILDFIELMKIKSLNNLKTLDLSRNNKIKQETIDKLLPYLPNCKIII